MTKTTTTTKIMMMIKTKTKKMMRINGVVSRMMTLFLLFLISNNTIIMKPVMACGALYCLPEQPVLQAGESIAFGVKEINDHSALEITMAVLINYDGPADLFSWILPVPTQPNLSVGSELLFERMFDTTRPTFEFTIDTSKSTTCNEEDFLDTCAPVDFAPVSSPVTDAEDEDGADAIVLEHGIVGPFEFVILEAAEQRPESIFEWLQENGYYQPDGSQPLVNYYASMDMKFVALRLTKDSDTGDIRPIIVKYEIIPPPSSSLDGITSPAGQENNGDVDDNNTLMLLVERVPVACVPIQLTSIAATPSMPIQIYMLGPVRAIPLNYFHVTLDDRQTNWLGCNRLFNDDARQDCYLNDFRNRFDETLNKLNGYGFVTEYAGPVSIVNTAIAVDIDIQVLSQQTSPLDFMVMLVDANIPDIPLVQTIIERFLPNQVQSTDSSVAPFRCRNLVNIYTPDQPWLMTDCIEFIDFRSTPKGMFDSEGLATELNIQVVEPAQKAQDWVNEYEYMTRLYGQLDPDQMNKDPFFSFDSTLEDVSRFHRATGVPVCSSNDGGPSGLDIHLGGTGNDNEEEGSPSYFLAAEYSCGTWFQTGGTFDLLPKVEVMGYLGEASRVLELDETMEGFSMTSLGELMTILDSRVPNQTIPEFEIQDYSSGLDDEVGRQRVRGGNGMMILILVIMLPLLI